MSSGIKCNSCKRTKPESDFEPGLHKCNPCRAEARRRREGLKHNAGRPGTQLCSSGAWCPKPDFRPGNVTCDRHIQRVTDARVLERHQSGDALTSQQTEHDQSANVTAVAEDHVAGLTVVEETPTGTGRVRSDSDTESFNSEQVHTPTSPAADSSPAARVTMTIAQMHGMDRILEHGSAADEEFDCYFPKISQHWLEHMCTAVADIPSARIVPTDIDTSGVCPVCLDTIEEAGIDSKLSSSSLARM